MRWFLVALLFVISCSKSSSSSSGSSGPSKLTLVDNDPSNKVNVEMVVPASWHADSQPNSWKMEGAYMLTLVFIDLGGTDNASRLAHAINAQFDKDAKVTRNDYPDGRAWIWETQPNGHFHARMFIPTPHGVVMGVALFDDKSKLDGIKAAFETIKVVP